MVDEFFLAWVTFSLMILGGAAGAAIWAWRKGLFQDQDRARSLPLWADLADEDVEDRRESRAGRKDGR